MRVRLCRAAEIPEGTMRGFDVDLDRILVAHVEGEFYAIDDTCSHADASLSKGDLTGPMVRCPLHGSRFDVRTGEVLNLPAVAPVESYPVIVEDGDLFVELG